LDGGRGKGISADQFSQKREKKGDLGNTNRERERAGVGKGRLRDTPRV